MAYKNMNVAPTRDGGEKGFAFEATDSLAAVSNGVSILIPDDINNINVVVELAAGASAKVQYTNNTVSEVKAGTETWIDWGAGAIAITTDDVFYPCTAIRLVQTFAGTCTLKVRAQ
jgi:hypothetical protein